MYVTPILFQGSAFAFSGVGRCRPSPLSTAALRAFCPFSVCPIRCQLPAAGCQLFLGCPLLPRRGLPAAGCKLLAVSRLSFLARLEWFRARRASSFPNHRASSSVLHPVTRSPFKIQVALGV